MIDTKELREKITIKGLDIVADTDVLELLDRLEAVEKERDELRALVVMRFDHDCPPQFTQGYALHELIEPVTAEHCRWFVAEIERLRTDCDALCARIGAMEKQEPFAWFYTANGGWDCYSPMKPPEDAYDAGSLMALYTRLGAKGG